MNALHSVAHDDEQTGPVCLCEFSESRQDARVNPLLVRLPQAHDQDPAVLFRAMLDKTFVRRDEHSLLGLGKRP